MPTGSSPSASGKDIMDMEGGERVTVKEKTPLERYLELPEGYPAELIEGEISMTPSPSYKHQMIAIDISSKMKLFADGKNAGIVLYEFDVHLDDENVVRPDIIFVRKERSSVIKENWVDGVPDLVVEVLSPSTATIDLIIKRDLYESRGVKEYWIIDPGREEIFVYENKDGKFVLSCHGKKCSSKVLEDFEWGFQEK